MARPRKRQYRHLPDGLVFDVSAQVYRLTLTTGKRKSLRDERNGNPLNQAMAIAVAREYNNIMRPLQGVNVRSLIRESGGLNGETEPFAIHARRLLDRAITEESPSRDTLDTWENDIVRVMEFFADIPSCDIELEHINGYLRKYHASASANVQNRKVAFLKKLFSYAVDESLMFDNPATRKKKRRVEGKVRRRLTLDDFRRIYEVADPWLRTAMDLSIQTTHARLEVTRIRYSIKQPKNGVCGCVWFDAPDAHGIHGVLYIHRQKTQHKEAAHVAIPIGDKLKEIIDSSRDSVASPYVIHRLPVKRARTSQEVNHPTQVAPDYLSRAFSDARDRAGVCSALPMDERPTFHEIRALAAHLFDEQGIDPQGRMAHSDAKSTKIYTQNHIDWIMVPHGEVKTG
ncbi:tyrosine-type recombinase/integrase [Entomohabitans teleogrylli]|uniref:tyrosine-type recombinase/integrase n=1 Tax=Entomohabitans teleogrylli TaxID=1384589 RepID=UPI00073D1F4B|nr:site-specific integrase [Entomohabitans teleogrylli]